MTTTHTLGVLFMLAAGGWLVQWGLTDYWRARALGAEAVAAKGRQRRMASTLVLRRDTPGEHEPVAAQQPSGTPPLAYPDPDATVQLRRPRRVTRDVVWSWPQPPPFVPPEWPADVEVRRCA